MTENYIARIEKLERDNKVMIANVSRLTSRLDVLERRIIGALETRNKMTIVFPENATPELIKRICEAVKDAAEQITELPNPLIK